MNEYDIRQCANCTHGWVAPLPTAETLSALYETEQPDSLLGTGLSRLVADIVDREGPRQKHFAERLHVLEQQEVRRDARILDVGCANGAFVRALRLSGYVHAAGFDVSPNLIEEGRQRWQLELHSGDFDAFVRARHKAFDFVFATHVFEHLAHPVLTLRSVAELLTRDGHVAIAVPNLKSLQVMVSGTRAPLIDPPHHVHYFTPESLRLMMEQAGFRVRSLKTPFWSRESDVYLTTKGIPSWGARAMGVVATVPGFAIQRLGIGGSVVAVASADDPHPSVQSRSIRNPTNTRT